MKERVRTLISEEEIDRRIREVAAQISEDYRGKPIHMICILKGGAMFMCELSKRIQNDNISLDFMSVSSYGSGMTSSGIVKIVKDLDDPLEGKNVLVVEDIVDTGHTLHHLLGILNTRKPASIEVCTLLNKPSRREMDVPTKYACFAVPDKFVVGYGLDYDQRYRNLPYIGVVEFEEDEEGSEG